MNEAKPPKKAIKLEIKVDETVGAGTYANLAIVNSSDSEFVMDFAFIQPGRPKAKVATRIIISPKNAKRMLMLLNKQIQVYEKRFGEIDVRSLPPMPTPDPIDVN
ncbi:MAG: DUF3467 domain-containing protein [Candidatus Lernaella stagnicola]|nr:DUF3467 domain-containing protein [Candidatus Lernaella stagnicola]